MVQLIDLPTETLAEIVAEVQNLWCSTPSLKALRLTCHRLLDIVNPFFFNTLTTARYYSDAPKNLLAFANAVARNPKLRKAVKTVDLLLERNNDFPGCTKVWISNDIEFENLREAAPSYFAENNERWWNEGTTIRTHPHVTALLSLLSNLETLRLKCKDPEIDQHLEQLGELHHNFSMLSELCIKASKPYSNVLSTLGPLAPFLQLPNLKKVNLKSLDLVGFNTKHSPPKFAERSLAINNLTIRNCNTTNEFIQNLITACKHMKSFDFRVWEDPEPDKRVDVETLDVEGWHAALSSHKETLERLSLECVSEHDMYGNTYSTYSGDMRPWPSFQSFTVLKDLKIEYRRMEYSALPQSLEALYLLDCRKILGNADIDGWCAIQKYCPHIQNFDIMTTQHCRSAQRLVKTRGFKWDDWTTKTRVYPKVSFQLIVWFKDFTDGTYDFSQGTDDTSEDDDDGEEEEEEEGEEDGDDDGDD